jgi:PilZ domain
MAPRKTISVPVAKTGGTGPSKDLKPPLDRRRHKRYPVEEGTLVCPVAKDRKYWKMLDVSMSGASFRYIPDEDMDSFAEIDIVTQNLDFALECLPFKLIWDCEFSDSVSSSSKLRRCGVEFGVLTQSQESLLAEFIRKYSAVVC